MAPQARHPTVVFFLGKLLGKAPRTGIKYEVDWDDGVVAWHPARDLLTLDALHNFVCLGNKTVLVQKVAGEICVYCDGGERYQWLAGCCATAQMVLFGFAGTKTVKRRSRRVEPSRGVLDLVTTSTGMEAWRLWKACNAASTTPLVQYLGLGYAKAIAFVRGGHRRVCASQAAQRCGVGAVAP